MGVKVYHNGDWVEFSTGSNASASFIVEEEGTPLVGLATALNFVGNGVTASNTTGNPSTKKIEITGVTTFLALSDTPVDYVGSASSVVVVNQNADGLEFVKADSSGIGVDNYVNSASFASEVISGKRGMKLTLGRTGSLSDVTTEIDYGTLGIGFTDLVDTPADYTGHAHKFVRVNKDGSTSNGTALEFVTQVPGTAVGAVGINSQVQYNDNGVLNGAKGLLYVKGDESDGSPAANLILKPNYTDFTSNTDSAIYGGGRISAESNDISNTISTPWNRASINADGGLELFRSRTTSPTGGPYIDFKSQLDGNNHPVDMDARIQMDYDRDANAPNNIEPDGADFSAILFETGGNGHYKTGNLGGRVTEKLRIGKFGEIGLNAGITRYDPTANPPIVDNQGSNRLPEADIYGNPGEVLMSDGKGKSVFWGTNGTGGNLWSQNSNGIYRLTDVMIRRSDNANNASLAVHGVTNLSGNVNSSKTVLDLRNINDNADCLTFRNIRLTQDNNTAPTWYTAAWRIQRKVDVTNQGYIQFGIGDGVTGVAANDLIFGNVENGTDKQRLRITSTGDIQMGISTTSSVLIGGLTDQVSVDTSKLAVQGADSSFNNGSNINTIQVHAGGYEVLGDLVGYSFSHGVSGTTARAKAAIAFESAGQVSNGGAGYGRGDLCFYVDNAADDNQVSADDERLRITRGGTNTYAGCDDIILNMGGGVATTNNVTGVINMGSSYAHDGTGTDLGKGSGHWRAVKLHLWKNNLPAQLPQDTINNIYGLGVSHGMMEIQTDANLGFFVGNDAASTGTYNGSRLERMRINTDGLVLIGTKDQLINESGLGVRSAGNTCVLKSEGSTSHNPLICWNSHNSGTRNLIQFGHSGTYTTNIGSITTNGTTTAYNASSDYRMKQDEVLITDGIEKVKLLKPRRFKWKSNLDLGMCDGFFAHEIEEATPASQATTGAKDAVATESDVTVGLATSIGEPIYQQVDQSKLIPVLTAALKEAIAKIETLEAKVATLEGS